MKSMLLVLSLAFINHVHRGASAFPKTAEQRLRDHLFVNQSIDARPVIDFRSAISVQFGMEIVQLFQLDERSQCITTKVWARQVWTNQLMTWNPKEWDNVNELTVHARDVWKPDIVLYNNAEASYGGGTEKYRTLIKLYPNGTNTWLSPTTFKSTCKIDVRYFPFDEQRCRLKFGSWSYDSSKLNLIQHEAPPISKQYVNSSTWHLRDILVAHNTILYNCCPTPYQDLTITFVFKRHPVYHIFNFIAPCIVLFSMVLFSFWLPAESGERLSLNITVLLALAVFLQFLGDTLPKNCDATPILSVFFITMMTECAVALTTTVIVLAVHHQGEDKDASSPPIWLTQFFLWIKMNHPRKSRRNRHTRFRQNVISGLFGGKEELFVSGSVSIINRLDEDARKEKMDKDDLHASSLSEIQREVSKITSAITNQEKQDRIAQEWKRLAKDLDRLFFAVFVLVFVLSGAFTLLGLRGWYD